MFGWKIDKKNDYSFYLSYPFMWDLIIAQKTCNIDVFYKKRKIKFLLQKEEK